MDNFHEEINVVTDEELIASWRERVELNIKKSPETALEYCNKIMKYALEKENVSYLGYAHYFSGEAYYTLNNVEKVLFHLSNAENYLSLTDNHELMARVYNLTAITSMTIGNSHYAMDYYIKSLGLSREHGIPFYEVTALINIGTLFYVLMEYESAKSYFNKALDFVDKHKDVPGANFFQGILYLNLGKCALYQDDMETALLNKKKIEKDFLDVTDPICFLMFTAKIAHGLGNEPAINEALEEISKQIKDGFKVMDYFDDFYEYANFLLDIGKENVFTELVKILDKLTKEAKVCNLERRLSELKIRYFLMKEDAASYLAETRNFYEKTQNMEKSNRVKMLSMLETRIELENERREREKMQLENSKLTKKSETDALTGLYNRFRLNHHAGEDFAKAIDSGLPFAIEILDIDYFKQFNDNYGHQNGDVCITMIAEEIKKLEKTDGVTTYRYGGDEFVITYLGLSEPAVRALAESLKKNICDRKMEHAYSKAANIVTISQGICWEYPREGENVWNYLHSADESLYEVKKYSRNSVTLNRYTGGF